jgi:WhiB family redox-sensing transcriptional regulator
MDTQTKIKWPDGCVLPTKPSSTAVLAIKTSWTLPASRTTASTSVGSVIERVELAPGVYLVRYRRWQPVSILDQNAELPVLVELVSPPRKKIALPQWQSQSLCVGMADEIFFGAEDARVRPPLSRSGLALAQSICEQCPVRRECLTWALEKPEGYGIWGGTSGRMREELMFRVVTGTPVATVVDDYLESD